MLDDGNRNFKRDFCAIGKVVRETDTLAHKAAASERARVFRPAPRLRGEPPLPLRPISSSGTISILSPL